jgi:hypothetical protein
VATPPSSPNELSPIADSWADSSAPTRTHATATSLRVDGKPKAEAFLMFDVSSQSTYNSLALHLNVSEGGGAISIYRVATTWTEAGLKWSNRPTTGPLVGTSPGTIKTGKLAIDISAAFANHTVDAPRLALRIVSTKTDGIALSSREAPSPAMIEFVGASPTPSPTASPTPSAPPSAAPTAAPTDIPTTAPTDAPTVAPTLAPDPSPTGNPIDQCPTEPVYYFVGHGTDHGVGLSQYGAKGRATAGQTYMDILNFYYTNVTPSTDRRHGARQGPAERRLRADGQQPGARDRLHRQLAEQCVPGHDLRPGQLSPVHAAGSAAEPDPRLDRHTQPDSDPDRRSERRSRRIRRLRRTARQRSRLTRPA